MWWLLTVAVAHTAYPGTNAAARINTAPVITANTSYTVTEDTGMNGKER